jgi:hypothetical protein
MSRSSCNYKGFRGCDVPVLSRFGIAHQTSRSCEGGAEGLKAGGDVGEELGAAAPAQLADGLEFHAEGASFVPGL